MTSKVEKSIEVEAPLQHAYNQWTQFEQRARDIRYRPPGT